MSDLKSTYELIKDPVRWCEAYLKDPDNGKDPLVLRNYQKAILSYRGKKRVIRMGRQMGKTVSMCAEIIWKAVTFEDKKILVVAPYQSHVDRIFEIIGHMIHDVPEIQDSCTIRRSPFYSIEFGNGTTIKGFTAGTRSGQAAESVRGQTGSDIYLDEVDYMGSTAVGAVKAIENARPGISIWASSTPCGKREQFWLWSTQPELFGFKAFHYTIRDKPDYSPEEERRFREEAPTENYFAQEFMAEWGNEAQGVYPQELLDNATRAYSYKPVFMDGVQLPGCLLEHQPGQNIYVMGVDWNAEGVGTRVVVWEWMIASQNANFQNKFRVFYHENINDYLKSRGVGYQHNIESTKRVIQLAEHFSCSHVYTDKGYGHTNMELIMDTYKKKGQLEKAIRMYKPVDFGSKVSIQSPDGRTIEKFAKEFIVSNAQRFLESDMLIFPIIEDEKYKLIGQFRQFVVEKIGVTGRRKYTDVNEDSHTAAILGLYAFFENYSILSTINREEEIVRRSGAFRKDLPARDVGTLSEKHIPGSTNTKPTNFGKLAEKHGYRYVDGSKGDPRDDTMSEVKAMRINKVAQHIKSGPPRRRTNVFSGSRRNI